MPKTFPALIPPKPALAVPDAVCSFDSPWQILERFLLELQQNHQPPQQIRQTLEAVRESTRADVVFWYPPPGQGRVVAVGANTMSPVECQQFAASALEQMGDEQTQFLWSSPDLHEPAARKPCSAALLRVGATNTAWLIAVSFDPRHIFQACDLQLLSLARRLLVSQSHQTKLRARLQDSLVSIVRCLTTTLDAKDPCTAGHSERVARIAVLLAKRLGLPAKAVNSLFLAGLLHDIGKIGIPDRLLQKAGQLTAKEFVLIQQHTLIGDRILATAKQLDHVRPGARSHHERFDGKGYPDGLAGEAIPLMGRILAVADSCDAMMSTRRYRSMLAPPQIDALFRLGAGKQWDPLVVEEFMLCRPQIYPPIYQKGIEESAYFAIADLADSHCDGSSMFFKVLAPEDEVEAR